MKIETLRTRVYDIVSSMDDRELVGLYNSYCDEIRYYGDRIYDIELFNELVGGCSPMEIANKIWCGDFCPNHNYFRFDGYANLESFDFGSDVIDIDELVDYIVENKDSLHNGDIEEVIDECIEEAKGDDKK